MSNKANYEYLESIREEYKNAKRREKSLLLAHAVFVTKLSRKRLIRLLKQPNLRPESRKKSGRKPKYLETLMPFLKEIWLQMEQPCGKKLKVLIPRLMPSYQKRRPEMTAEIIEHLQAISPATIDRTLRKIKVKSGLSLTRPPKSSWYKTAIPITPKDFNVTEPGHTQCDTVSHCGESGIGAFASTLTLTDIDSHWTEMRATWTKVHTGIIRGLQSIEKELPFPLKSINFDSGSEFMNHAVIRFLRSQGESYGRKSAVHVTRSRPYRKNDNCYVEQKNLTHVRQLIGYDRIDCQTATRLMDELYRDLWCPFLNFFMPTFKLLSKERVGSKIIKKHEAPKTPYERVLASAQVAEETKAKLRQRYESMDPFLLKEQIEIKLKQIFKLIREEKQPVEHLGKAA